MRGIDNLTFLHKLLPLLEKHIKLDTKKTCKITAEKLLIEDLPDALKQVPFNALPAEAGEPYQRGAKHPFAWELLMSLALLRDKELYSAEPASANPNQQTPAPAAEAGKNVEENHWWDIMENAFFPPVGNFKPDPELDQSLLKERGLKRSLSWFLQQRKSRKGGTVRKAKIKNDFDSVRQELEEKISERLSEVVVTFTAKQQESETYTDRDGVMRRGGEADDLKAQKEILKMLEEAMGMTYFFSRFCGFETHPNHQNFSKRYSFSDNAQKNADAANGEMVFQRVKDKEHLLIENNLSPLGILQWLSNPKDVASGGAGREVAEAFRDYDVWLALNLVEKAALWQRNVGRALAAVVDFQNPFTTWAGPRLPNQEGADAWAIRDVVAKVVGAIATAQGAIGTALVHHFVVVDNNGGNLEDKLLAAVDFRTESLAPGDSGSEKCRNKNVEDVMGLPMQWQLMDVVSSKIHDEDRVTHGLDTAFLCENNQGKDYKKDWEEQKMIAKARNTQCITGAGSVDEKLAPLKLTATCKERQENTELQKKGESSCWKVFCGFERRVDEIPGALETKMKWHLRMLIAESGKAWQDIDLEYQEITKVQLEIKGRILQLQLEENDLELEASRLTKSGGSADAQASTPGLEKDREAMKQLKEKLNQQKSLQSRTEFKARELETDLQRIKKRDFWLRWKLSKLENPSSDIALLPAPGDDEATLLSKAKVTVSNLGCEVPAPQTKGDTLLKLSQESDSHQKQDARQADGPGPETSPAAPEAESQPLPSAPAGVVPDSLSSLTANLPGVQDVQLSAATATAPAAGGTTDSSGMAPVAPHPPAPKLDAGLPATVQARPSGSTTPVDAAGGGAHFESQHALPASVTAPGLAPAGAPGQDAPPPGPSIGSAARTDTEAAAARHNPYDPLPSSPEPEPVSEHGPQHPPAAAVGGPTTGTATRSAAAVTNKLKAAANKAVGVGRMKPKSALTIMRTNSTRVFFCITVFCLRPTSTYN